MSPHPAPRHRSTTPIRSPAWGPGPSSETFAHLYPPEDLETFLAYAYGLERRARAWPIRDKATWLLEDDGEAIGYATAGPCGLPHDDVKPGDGELHRIYVLKELPGRRRARCC
jgi:hypothetical protein